MKDICDRFWSKVNILGKDDCWNWTAGIDTPGYGGFKYNGKKINSHVMTWILTNGEVPKGFWILHTCDNKLCCNPNHLFLGTPLDNVRDMIKKGRNVVTLKIHPELAARGEKASSAKLKAFQVIEIREKLKQGFTLAELSREYKVDARLIAGIRDNKYWKSVCGAL